MLPHAVYTCITVVTRPWRLKTHQNAINAYIKRVWQLSFKVLSITVKCIFKVIELVDVQVSYNQCSYFENAPACYKRMCKRHVTTGLKAAPVLADLKRTLFFCTSTNRVSEGFKKMHCETYSIMFFFVFFSMGPTSHIYLFGQILWFLRLFSYNTVLLHTVSLIGTANLFNTQL